MAHYFFLKFSMVLGAHMLLCLTEPDFFNKIFLPKMGKMGQKCAKKGFLNLLENLVINFFWIRSIVKVYIICCILAQIPYLGKIWFLRYGPKYSLPIRLQDFKSTISLEQNDAKAWFFACWYRLMEIRSWLKNIGVGMVKMGVTTLFSGF